MYRKGIMVNSIKASENSGRNYSKPDLKKGPRLGDVTAEPIGSQPV
jgi:hypothetical protein